MNAGRSWRRKRRSRSRDRTRRDRYIERAVITSTSGKLNIDLPSPVRPIPAPESSGLDAGSVRTDAQIRQLEADNIRAALKATRGKVSGPGGAAQLLGMKSTTLA